MVDSEGPISSKVQWFGLVSAASGMFLTSLDITVNVALPNITDSFGTDAVTIQWIIILYVGSSTAMHLGLGGAADAFGLKRMFVFGLIAYTVAVFAIGFAQTLGLLFGLRVFQAFGNGLLMVLAPAIVTRLFPSEFRGRALGIMAALGTLGMMAGSLGGGALVDAFGWRAIFLGRVPLCLAAIAFSAALLRLPDDPGRREEPGASRGFDVWGSAALFTAVGALILMLSLGGRNGWTAVYVPLLGVLAVAGIVAFVLAERRAERPILQLSLLRNRVLASALVVAMLAMVSTFVNWFLLPFFVVESLGASASVWGLLLMLMTVATVLSAPLGGWLSDRWRPVYTITGGLIVATIAMVSLSALDAGSSAVEVALGLVGVGVATGLFQSANANLIMGSMPADRLGMGGGIMGLSRGLGVVFSVAIMGAIFAARVGFREASLPEDQAFILAFQDTYRIAVVLGLAAIAVSCTIWPVFLRGRR